MASRALNDDEVLNEMNKMVHSYHLSCAKHQTHPSIFPSGRVHQTGGRGEGEGVEDQG